jgi:hypothetical protein
MGSWVRPVSARPSAEISEEERRYQNGDDPKVLEIVTIQMLKAVPRLHQQENHLIDESFYWEKSGTATWKQLQTGVENPAGPLWLNESSSGQGVNDRVPEAELTGIKRSLYLIRPEDLVISVASEGGDFAPARRRVRARFSHSGCHYKIGVTDPIVEREFLAGKDGETRIGEALMCLSLGELFHGNAYKLAAAIITPKRAGA